MSEVTTVSTVAIERLQISRFNSRKTRTDEQIARLAERISRNGFEQTRALWVTPDGDKFDIFAGGTRYEAAKQAGLTEIPVRVFEGLSDEQVAKLETEDNENDEYHAPVPRPDIWSECARLKEVEGWDQEKFNQAKGWSQPTVSTYLRLHRCKPVHLPVLQGKLKESHAREVVTVYHTCNKLTPWLSTEQAQEELVSELLKKGGVLCPSTSVAVSAAKRWKDMIAEAIRLHDSLDPESQERFVALLKSSQARNISAITRAHGEVIRLQADAKRKAEQEAQAAASSAERARIEAEQEAERAKAREEFLSRCVNGDSRETIKQAPTGAKLMLTDPPYGQAFQSNRRKATAKKKEIENDGDLETALSLLRDVITAALPGMAEDAHFLVFSGWRYERHFWTLLEELGLEVKSRLIWVKDNHGTGDLERSYAPKHESIIHAVKGDPKLNKRIPDVIEAPRVISGPHPTEKPQSLLEKLIESATEPGDLILEPFAGSGSTLLAAAAQGREFWGCEFDKEYHSDITDKLLAVFNKGSV